MFLSYLKSKLSHSCSVKFCLWRCILLRGQLHYKYVIEILHFNELNHKQLQQ